jgi:RISC-loading complex subunit TARBP2
LIFGIFFAFSETAEKENTEEQYDDEEDGDSNPVGKLQEICMKRHWRPPHYETISEEGLPHERVFKMKCIIENMDFNETGIGKSKRLAKRKAAHLMIKRLKEENLADSDELTVSSII